MKVLIGFDSFNFDWRELRNFNLLTLNSKAEILPIFFQTNRSFNKQVHTYLFLATAPAPTHTFLYFFVATHKILTWLTHIQINKHNLH